jgi:hypothetical protein
MSTTIKGPIQIGGKNNKVASQMVMSGLVDLPFRATGWVSEFNSELVKEPDAEPGPHPVPILGPVEPIEPLEPILDGEVSIEDIKKVRRKK